MLGEKYNLPSIDIFNDNGTLSEAAGLYVGMDRFDVRKQIEEDLRNAGLLEKVEAYENKVGFSGAYERAYRTEIVYAMVLEDGTSSPDRLGAGHEATISSSIRRSSRTPTAIGWRISRTGVSAVSFGGDTVSRLTCRKVVTW